jgi:hypothetical protein
MLVAEVVVRSLDQAQLDIQQVLVAQVVVAQVVEEVLLVLLEMVQVALPILVAEVVVAVEDQQIQRLADQADLELLLFPCQLSITQELKLTPQ